MKGLLKTNEQTNTQTRHRCLVLQSVDDIKEPDILIQKAIPKAKAVGASASELLLHWSDGMVRHSMSQGKYILRTLDFFQRLHIFQKHFLTPLSECLCRSFRKQLFLLLIHHYWIKENWLVCHKSFPVIVIKQTLLRSSGIQRTPPQKRNRCDREWIWEVGYNLLMGPALLGLRLEENIKELLKGCIAFKGLQRERGHFDRG